MRCTVPPRARAPLVVISCENHAYHGWQALVATYSCMQRQRTRPVIVLHGAVEGPPDPAFLEAQAGGAVILRSRNYRGGGRYDWAARNTAASLMDAARLGREVGASHLVLMDPDMVWTRKVIWPNSLAVDRINMKLIETPRARAVAGNMGLDLPADAAKRYGARVPYVVPLDMADDLGGAWWEAMECYIDQENRHWSDQMVAWGIAMAKVGVEPEQRRFCQVNGGAGYKENVEAPLIHYAYDTPYWDKSWFSNEETQDWSELWEPPHLPVQSVQGWVHREIRQARAYFDALKAAA